VTLHWTPERGSPGASASDGAMLAAARELIDLGAEGLFGPAAEELVAEVSRRHAARAIYERSTAEAIARHELPGVDPEALAREVFSNFAWTHFVSKLFLVAAPDAVVAYVANQFDTDDVEAVLELAGPSILSGFHYAAYPLVALGLAMSPAAPVISKARVDVLDRPGAGASDQIVHLSDRSAAIRLTRALRQGRSVWALVDVVLPATRTARTEFLGRGMTVSAGFGKVARLSGRACLPISWRLQNGGIRVEVGAPVHSAERSEGEIIDAAVAAQAAFVRAHPSQWLEWYSLLDDAPAVRAEVRQGNEAIWDLLGPVL
jgi:lauroyl/myristoyl acyltransferase